MAMMTAWWPCSWRDGRDSWRGGRDSWHFHGKITMFSKVYVLIVS